MKLLTDYDKNAVGLASAALSKISKFHHNREITSPKPRPPKGFLYHYTTTNGLKGIIEKNEIWATSAYFLNDSTEIIYGCRVLKQAVDDWMARNPRVEDSLSLRMGRQLKQVFGEHLLNMTQVRPIFLCCLCEDDNVLSQWTTYGRSGGYSIGFKLPAEDMLSFQGLRPEPNICTSKWLKVEYDRNAQLKRCGTILDSILPIFDDPSTVNGIAAVDDHPFLGYAAILRVVMDLLLEEVVCFKDEAFKSENEWRIVVRQREWLKQGTDDGSKVVKPIHFRTSANKLIPYVRLIPYKESDKLPIACIRYGPTTEITTTHLAVSLLLEQNGFSSVPVQPSGIPLRP